MVKVETNGENGKVYMENVNGLELMTECVTTVISLYSSLKNKDELFGKTFLEMILNPDTFSEENLSIIEHYES